MSTVVVGTIQSNSTSPPTFNNTNGTEIGTLCRAFCNFNGTGTVAIRASFNVTSITDNGVGAYTVNMATAMPDANYSPTVNGGSGAGASASGLLFNSAPSTTAFSVGILNSAGSFTDREYVCVSVFR